MKDNSIDDPFYLKIQSEVNRIEKKANRFTWLFYSVRIVQVALAGTITVLSGWKTDNSLVILILGAVMTAVTAIDTLFQIDAKKNTYKLILFELRSIRADLVFECIKSMPLGEGKVKLQNDVIKLHFEKYKQANSYARDLIGTDTKDDSSNGAGVKGANPAP